MVSTRYLFEVAELSCLKSILAVWVTSVNRTSGASVAPIRYPIRIKTGPDAVLQRRADRGLLMMGPCFGSIRISWCRVFPSLPAEQGGDWRADSGSSPSSRTARQAHHFVDLAVPTAGDFHPSTDGRPIGASTHTLDHDPVVPVSTIVAQQRRRP